MALLFTIDNDESKESTGRRNVLSLPYYVGFEPWRWRRRRPSLSCAIE